LLRIDGDDDRHGFRAAAEGLWRIDADAESTISCRRRCLPGGGQRARLDVWPRDPDADMCARKACRVEHKRLHGSPGSVHRSMARAVALCRSLQKA
jgi:hypothetical protein